MNGFDKSAQSMSLVAFLAVATVALLLCVMTGPDRDDLDEFYAGSRSLSPLQNGLALAGDYLSAATVLSTTGIIALTGYDGTILALSITLSLVLLMFLLAEPCATRAGSPWATCSCAAPPAAPSASPPVRPPSPRSSR